MLPFVHVPVPAPQLAMYSPAQAVQAPLPQAEAPAIPAVPFFSQFTDISSPAWQEVGCGITSLAMMIDFYKPNATTVETLLQQAIIAGAYDQKAGWTTDGLMQLSEQYGLSATYHDLSELSSKTALAQFKTYLKDGPLILSVHNKFNPKSKVPHLVVIDGIKDNVVYYNDPAAKTGEEEISVTALVKGWKKKMIVLRPTENIANTGLSLL